MSMDIFKKVLGNIDKNDPFSMSPKLILALLVLTGVLTIIIGIPFIWCKEILPSLLLQWETYLS